MIDDSAATSAAQPTDTTASLAAVAGSDGPRKEEARPKATKDNVKLIIKASSQQYDDVSVDSELSWTVRRLKAHLSLVYPGKPPVEQQKLIYSGKLLEDSQKIADILRCYKDVYTQNHIVHLVCPAKSLPKIDRHKINMPRTGTAMSGDGIENDLMAAGLRHRHVAGMTPGETQYQQQQAFWSTQANAVTPQLAGINAQAMAASQAQFYAAWMQQVYAQYMLQMQQQAATNGTAPPQMPLPQMPSPYGVIPTPFAGTNVSQMPMSMMSIVSNSQQSEQQMPQEPVPAPVPAPENAPQPVRAMLAAPRFPQLIRDDGEDNQDWLDGFYGILRLAFFLMIFYLNFSPIRCLLVILIIGVIYLYNNRILRFNREHNNNNRLNEQNNNANERAEDAAEPDNGNANNVQAHPNAGVPPAPAVADAATTNADREAQPMLITAICLMRNVVMGYFSTLLPDLPPA